MKPRRRIAAPLPGGWHRGRLDGGLRRRGKSSMQCVAIPPDGRGIAVCGISVRHGDQVTVNDDLALYLTKPVSDSFFSQVL